MDKGANICMISLPLVVNAGNFEIQLSLFWYHHKKVYGIHAYRKSLAMIVRRNYLHENKINDNPWNIGVPHVMTESCFDYLNFEHVDYLPLNTITSLAQVLCLFDDEEVLELIDCDQFHMRPHPNFNVQDNEIVCDIIPEEWHLKSKTENKYMVMPHISLGAFSKQMHSMEHLYNGGFVPLIAKVKTFKKMIIDWIQATKKIFREAKVKEVGYWSSMYGLQVACANNGIKMRAEECVYIPPFALKDSHYCCHYAVDPKFDKKKINTIDDIDVSKFDDNIFYNGVKEWYYWRKK